MSGSHGAVSLLSRLVEWQQLSIRVLPTTRAQSFFQVVVVAEWLRRWTRNPLGFPRVGSNPTDYEHCLVGEHSFYKEIAS